MITVLCIVMIPAVMLLRALIASSVDAQYQAATQHDRTT